MKVNFGGFDLERIENGIDFSLVLGSASETLASNYNIMLLSTIVTVHIEMFIKFITPFYWSASYKK